MRSLVVALLSCACGPPLPLSGEPVSTGVARARFEVRTRHTDVVRTTVLFPSDGAGKPTGHRHPALVYVQGGLVKAEGYEWLAERLVRAGYVVALPEHPADLAFFAIDSGEAARRLLTSGLGGPLLDGLVDPERVGVAGHSLGAVVAAKLILGGGFSALAIHASYPDPADLPALKTVEVPVMSLAGELDCGSTVESILRGLDPFGGPTVFAVVKGATHYQFTASDEPDRSKGCLPALSLDAAHDAIAEATRRFFDAALSTPADTGAAALARVPSVEVPSR